MADARRMPHTEIAKLYGRPSPDPFRVIPLKSGLSPITSQPNATLEEQNFADEVRWYQRKQFANFTAAELEKLGALAPVCDIEENEADPIPDIGLHPAFSRNKWCPEVQKHVAEFPMGPGRDGYWNARENDIVWEALLPSLRIASLYLTNAHLWPWWDALLAEEYIAVPEHEIVNAELKVNPRGEKYLTEEDRGTARSAGWKRFFIRPVLKHGTKEAGESVRNKIIDISKSIDWHLTSGRASWSTGLPESHDGQSIFALTEKDATTDRLSINISLEFLEALLPGNIEKLNIAEKRMRQCLIARTVLHELCHGLLLRIFILRHPDLMYPVVVDRELYFEQEQTQELGCSMEQFVYGSLVESINNLNREERVISWPDGAFMSFDFSGAICCNENAPILSRGTDDDFLSSYFYPVPVTHFIDEPSMVRFDCLIRKYGGQAARLGQRVVGSQVRIQKRNGRPQAPPRYPFEEFEGISTYIPARSTAARVAHITDLEKRAREVYIRGKRQSILRMSKRHPDPNFVSPSQNIRDIEPAAIFEQENLESEPLECPRFEEISAYLIKNREKLALHTMCFRMPEQTLRAHILRLGGLDISAHGWRTFLLHCQERQHLFKFQPEGLEPVTATYRGTIMLHASSWPRSEFQGREPPGLALQRYLQVWENIARRAAHMRPDYSPWANQNFWDHDSNDIKNHLNAKTDMNPPLSDHEWDCITWFMVTPMPHLLAMCTGMAVPGPPGVLRKLPLTGAETLEFMQGRYEQVRLPKGRSVVNWEGGEEYLREWDEAEYEGFHEDNGVTWTNGIHLSYDDYLRLKNEEEARAQRENREVNWPPVEVESSEEEDSGAEESGEEESEEEESGEEGEEGEEEEEQG